jgi:hypothetical protein
MRGAVASPAGRWPAIGGPNSFSTTAIAGENEGSSRALEMPKNVARE